MNEGTIALTVMTLALLLIFTGMFVWGLRTGQFRNVEDAKYQVFRKYPSTKEHDQTSDQERRRGGKHNGK